MPILEAGAGAPVSSRLPVTAGTGIVDE